MKLLSIAVLVILLSMNSASADGSSLDPRQVGEDMISGGINGFVVNMADSMMDFVCGDGDGNTTGNTTDSDEGHDAITKTIIGFASWSVSPFQYPSIISMLGMSFALAVGFLVVYIFLGAASTSVSGATGQKHAGLKALLGTNNNGSMENYVTNVVTGILAMSLMAMFVYVMLLIAKALKLMILASIATSISPSIASMSMMYLMMAIMWLMLAISFAISNIVICITAGMSFLLGALYASDKTRHIAVKMVDYFFTMVLMQVLVVGAVSIVVGMIMDIKTGKYGALLIPSMEASMYIGLILLMVFMCISMIIGKISIIKTAKTVVKLVV